MTSCEKLRINKWSFSPVPLPSFNPITLVSQLLKCRGQHRNHFWKNEYTQIYRFAFSVPIQDRVYLLKDSGNKVPVSYKMYNILHNLISMLTKSSDSAKLIEWRKYGKGEDIPKVFERYFGVNHPLSVKSRSL